MAKTATTTSRRQDTLTRRLLDQLKALFRQNGLRFTDVAIRIDKSERSVKRYMSGHGLTLEIMELLCSAVDITFLELTEFVRQSDLPQPTYMSAAQEEALADDQSACLMYKLLATGWSPSKIQKELEIPEASLIGILMRLDRLGIITLFPGNKVRLLVSLRPVSERSPRLRSWISKAVIAMTQQLDLNNGENMWEGTVVRLAPSSYARVVARAGELVAEVEQLSAHDANLSRRDTRWYAISTIGVPVIELAGDMLSPKPLKARTAFVGG